MTIKNISSEEIKEGFKRVQDAICNFLIEETDQKYLQDTWDYHKGTGGGITRVWEGENTEDFYVNVAEGTTTTTRPHILEKAGVNFSFIQGQNLPSAAVTQFKIAPDSSFIATGVSLVIHPYSPLIPTIHMNVRYFEAGDVYWFGGGVDLTPVYPEFDKCVQFHKTLKNICDKYGNESLNITYDIGKKECDQYFYLPHRSETRGVGGLFFDHLKSQNPEDKAKIWEFVYQLGMGFIDLYRPFICRQNQSFSYTKAQREFQLYRRSRYVEFNLLFDRGTKFGIVSEGRTESILMSLPAVAKWKYNYSPPPNTQESKLTDLYLIQGIDWINLTNENQLLKKQ